MIEEEEVLIVGMIKKEEGRLIVGVVAEEALIISVIKKEVLTIDIVEEEEEEEEGSLIINMVEQEMLIVSMIKKKEPLIINVMVEELIAIIRATIGGVMEEAICGMVGGPCGVIF